MVDYKEVVKIVNCFLSGAFLNYMSVLCEYIKNKVLYGFRLTGFCPYRNY